MIYITLSNKNNTMLMDSYMYLIDTCKKYHINLFCVLCYQLKGIFNESWIGKH